MTEQQRIDHFFAMPGARATGGANSTRSPRIRARGRAERSAVQAAMSALGGYEAFFAYPGKTLLSTLEGRVASGQAEAAASLVRRISEGILTRSDKDTPGDWTTAEQEADAGLDCTPGSRGRLPATVRISRCWWWRRAPRPAARRSSLKCAGCAAPRMPSSTRRCRSRASRTPSVRRYSIPRSPR